MRSAITTRPSEGRFTPTGGSSAASTSSSSGPLESTASIHSPHFFPSMGSSGPASHSSQYTSFFTDWDWWCHRCPCDHFAALMAVSFIAYSTRFLTEPVGLAAAMWGIYFFIRFYQSKTWKGTLIYPFVSALVFRRINRFKRAVHRLFAWRHRHHSPSGLLQAGR